MGIRTGFDPQSLHSAGEYFAAGYYEFPDAEPLRRWSRAFRRQFENYRPVPYRGELLYPCGDGGPMRGDAESVLKTSYSFTWRLDAAAFERVRAAEKTDHRIGGYSAYFNSLSQELKETVIARTEHMT